jgi:uncharacterized protein YndB with AHSA1/START domain
MTHELKYERGFDASLEQVFEAFTTHRGQRAMFQQNDPSWLFESDLDLRVGGKWEVASGLSRDELYRFTHVFREIDRPHRLTFSVSEQGPGGPSFDSEVEVTFDQRDDVCDVRSALFRRSPSRCPSSRDRPGIRPPRTRN